MIEDKTSELQARFHAKETVMVSYVAIFGILTASVTVLSLIRQKTFWGDFRDFWIGFWNILVAAATLIGNGFSQIANLCDRIPQRYLAVIAHWIVLIGLVIGLGAFIGFGVVKLIKFYAEPILNGITPWNGSVSVIALAAVVFFGDYIKNILKFNLFGIWIILTVILIGLGIYLSYGKSNRGYY